MGLVGIAELAVDLVGNQEEVVPEAEIPYRAHFLLREELSGGVAGIADEHRPGSGCHEFLELGYVGDRETVPDVGLHGLECDSVEVGEGLVVGVVGLDHDYLVASVGDYLHRVGEGLAAGYLDEQLVGTDVYADPAVVFLHHGLPEFHEAGGVGIGEVVQVLAPPYHLLDGAVG